MKTEEIDSMINAMSKEIDEKDKLIEKLSKAIIFLGTNEKLTVEEVIEMFSDDKRTEIFDDFMKRWEKMQWEESHLKDEVINLIAEDYLYDYLWNERSDNPCDYFDEIQFKKECISKENRNCKECLKDFYFKKARGGKNGINASRT